MNLKKNDFIAIEFTGKIKDGDIFDSNTKEGIEKSGLKLEAKHFIFSLGQGMFLKAIDNFIVGKEIGKDYHINLSAKDAFGERDTKLIKLIPIQVFKQHKINPIPGFMFNFDGRIAKILSASGGRVRVDFNNPLAGKDVEYDVKILRKVDDLNEQIKSFNEFLFKKDFKFEVKDRKLILEADDKFSKFISLFKDKYKEIFSLDLEVKELKQDTKKE
jgi:FKBP-type peptidyl-prolyl cis-trans isomerase 2